MRSSGWAEPLPVLPGEAEVVVETPGHAPIRQKVTLAAGERKSLSIDAAADAPAVSELPTGAAKHEEIPASGPRYRPIAIAAGAVAVAGLATFAIAGAMSNGTYSDLKSACGDRACPPDKASDIDAGETQQTIANVGLVVAHSKHHLHAYYMIRNSELAGLTDNEIEVIAQIARYHRKSEPKQSHEAFAALDDGDQRMVRALAAVLRIAIGLDRRHEGRVVGVEVADQGGDTGGPLTIGAVPAPGADMRQAGISIAVVWHFNQQMIPELLPVQRYPLLAAFSAAAEALPEFQAAPHGDSTFRQTP